jgi:hypothetical protein
MKSLNHVAVILLLSLIGSAVAVADNLAAPPQSGQNFTAGNGMEMVWVAPLNCWVGKYPVTQDEYEKVTGENPSQFQGGRNPVESVSWNDATEFCSKLTEKEKASGALPAGYAYTLPTDDQFTVLLGNATVNDGVTSIGTPIAATAPVGTKDPNQYGLYDTIGDVTEWCEDWYTKEIDAKNTRKYTSSIGETRKVFRGVAWHETNPAATATYHAFFSPDRHRNDLGFRCVLVPVNSLATTAETSAVGMTAPDLSLKITYVPEGSARLESKGFQKQSYPALDTDNPNDIATGRPLYFDLHTGKTIHYQVESAQPLTKLTYTGVAFEKFQIAIHDADGKVLAVSGTYDYGNHQHSVELLLPGLTRFEVVIYDNPRDWLLIDSLVFESNGVAQNPAPSSVATALLPPPSPAPVSNAATSSATKMTEDQSRAVVLIVGDNGEGTGFMIKTMDGPAVVTNLHVIGNNPNFKITTTSGALVTVLSAKAASDRDLVLLAIKDAGYSYLDVSTDISRTVQPGDEVITPGNSEGGEVMLDTVGKVLGIGPVRIEFDNPIYHGNSGGPVFQPKSGKVLGVVTEAMKVDNTDELDKASFANRASAIHSSMRYFGLRIDTVSDWVPIDWARFQTETIFLDQFSGARTTRS